MGQESNPTEKVGRSTKSKSGSLFARIPLVNKFRTADRNVKLAISLTAVLALVGIGLYGFTRDSSAPVQEVFTNEASQDIDTLPTTVAKISLKEGTIQYKDESGEWQDTTLETTVQEGTSLRTVGATSRAVTTLSDGSVIRLDANSELFFDTYNDTRVVIVQKSGYSYSRVFPNTPLDFIVSSEDAQYEAGGTAFRVAASGDEQAIEVFHGNVIEANSNKTAKEGEKFIVKNVAQPKKDNTVEKLDIELLKNDDFILWNIEQDKNTPEFAKLLGFLSDTTAPTLTISSHKDGDTLLLDPNATEGTIQFSGTSEKGTTLTVTSKNSADQSAIPVTIADDGSFTTPLVTAPVGSATFNFLAKDTRGNKTETTIRINFQKKSGGFGAAGVISLSAKIEGSKVKASWVYSDGNQPVDGVKLVYSKTQEKPQYKVGDSKTEASESGKEIEINLSQLSDNTTYYFVACYYNATADTCSNYSSVISLKTP